MTVFKTYLKILRKNMAMIIIFSALLILYGVLNFSSKDQSVAFSAVKPDIVIVNRDENKGITKGFIKYIKANSNTPEVADNEDARSDALFYNDTDFIIYIPENFNDEFMKGNIKEIDVKEGNNFNASYAEMLINRYLKLASTYRRNITDGDELAKVLDKVIENETEINITTKLDTDSLAQASFFYNFESYSLIICLVFIISLILTTFNSENIKKRTVISSTSYKKNNRILLLCNLLYAFTIWIIYTIISIILVGDVMFTSNGIMFIINSFVYLINLTTFAFLIGNVIKNKNIVNGVTNVIGIASSFFCGVFVPTEYLPDTVVKVAHIMPTYYYVNTNDLLTSMEKVNLTNLQPVFINMGVLLGTAVLFVIASNIITNKQRKIA